MCTEYTRYSDPIAARRNNCLSCIFSHTRNVGFVPQCRLQSTVDETCIKHISETRVNRRGLRNKLRFHPSQTSSSFVPSREAPRYKIRLTELNNLPLAIQEWPSDTMPQPSLYNFIAKRPGLLKLLKPIARWQANAAGYRQIGLRYGQPSYLAIFFRHLAHPPLHLISNIHRLSAGELTDDHSQVR